MYRPVFDMFKSGLIENVLTRAERVNAETPWVIGFSIDDDKTEIRLTASLKKPVKRAFEIRLEPLIPHTNYTEDREFKEERKAQMKHLAAYLQDILDVEKTRDQHIHLDRTCENAKKNIALLASSVTSHAAYAAPVSYSGDKESLTFSVRPCASNRPEPLIRLVVGLVAPSGIADDATLRFKTNRNGQLSEIHQLLTDLDNATRKGSN